MVDQFVGFADDDTNPIDLSISGGIGGRGLVPGRDDDTFGLGLSYADFDTNGRTWSDSDDDVTRLTSKIWRPT